MSTTSRSATVVLALLLTAALTQAATESSTLLDGKSFYVRLTKADAKSGTPDTLSFAKGLFDSTACHRFGFGESSYTASKDGDMITFEVHAIGKDQGKETWNGTFDGDKIHGTMMMTDAKGEVTNFHFEGRIKSS